MALTLRAVSGLPTSAIATAFLVPESTMAQRLSRARNTLRDTAVRFEKPTPEELPTRVAAVLDVLYLIFNEGYARSTGDTLLDTSLADEAIRLARLLHALADATNGREVCLFFKENTAAGTPVVTASWTTAAGQDELDLFEYSGMATASSARRSTRGPSNPRRRHTRSPARAPTASTGSTPMPSSIAARGC